MESYFNRTNSITQARVERSLGFSIKKKKMSSRVKFGVLLHEAFLTQIWVEIEVEGTSIFSKMKIKQ